MSEATDIMPLVDVITGETVNYRETTTWEDGTPITDAKTDGTIFRKKDAKYYRLQFSGPLNVKWFGAKGDGITNDTVAIQKCIAFLRSVGEGTAYFPSGTYIVANLGRTAYTNISYQGAGMDETIIKDTTADIVFNHDSDVNETSIQPFVRSSHISDLTLQGGAGTKVLLNVNAVAQSTFRNINLMDASATEGIAVKSSSVSCTFDNVICSKNKHPEMAFIPYIGLKLVEGFRQATSYGRSTNNTFINFISENMPRGWWINLGETNTFVGGTPEANTEYSLTIDTLNKNNVFIGVAFESQAAPVEIVDNGRMTYYTGCYSSNKIIIGALSQGVTWQNGMMDKVTIEAGSQFPSFINSYFNHYQNPVESEVFVNNSTGRTFFKNLWNRYNGTIKNDSYDALNDATYKFTYSSLSSAANNTGAGHLNEYLECNYGTAGTQTVTLQSSTTARNGVIKFFRNNSTVAAVSIVCGAGVTINGSSATTVSLPTFGDVVMLVSNGVNTWRICEIRKPATTAAAGVVKMSAASADTAAAVGASYSQTEVQAILTELRDLKTKMRTAGLLAP